MKKALHKPHVADMDVLVNVYGGDWCDGDHCGLEW
jgi:hypothetical protein